MRVVLLTAGAWDSVPDADPQGAQQALARLADTDRVSVAAVHGEATGAGAHAVLASDLPVLEQSARLVLSELPGGGVPAYGTTQVLVQRLGQARALELLATGRPLGAAEALGCGLAAAVVPDGEAAAAARELAAALLAVRRDALVEGKALLRDALRRSPQQQCEAEREALQRLSAPGEE